MSAITPAEEDALVRSLYDRLVNSGEWTRLLKQLRLELMETCWEKDLTEYARGAAGSLLAAVQTRTPLKCHTALSLSPTDKALEQDGQIGLPHLLELVTKQSRSELLSLITLFGLRGPAFSELSEMVLTWVRLPAATIPDSIQQELVSSLRTFIEANLEE